MKISVIIPVYNDPRLEACLEALSKQTLPQDQFEVVVVDNRSDNPQRALVERYPFAHWTEESTPGSFAARNKGLKLIQGELVAFTDSDCVPAPDWLEACVAAMGAEDSAVTLAGHVEVFPHNPSSPKAVELLDIAIAFDQEQTTRDSNYGVTANLIAPRESFSLVGPFNEELLSGSDGEWCHRAVDAGIPIRYCAEAIVAHPARTKLSEIIRKRRRIVGGRLKRNQGRSPVTMRFWGSVVRNLIPNMTQYRRGKKKLSALGHGFISQAKYTAVVFFVHYIGVLESLRLRLGGTAERR